MRLKKSLIAFGTIALLICMTAFSGSILTPLSDSVNSGIINTKILADHSLSGTHIDATVINGVAVFSGEVKSTTQKEELVSIANSVSGVKSVDTSRIKVVPH